MGKYTKAALVREETYAETSTGDSSPLSTPERLSKAKAKGRKEKWYKETSQPQPAQIRLFRFSLKHSRKTLRIPLFEEQLLNLPLRFTRRTNPMEADNDVETDEELAGSEVERCQNWLLEAIAQQQ